MLILTRRLGESIRVGDDIKITVVEIRGGNIRLGIEAPTQIKVHREEIYERIKEENRLAAASSSIDLSVANRLMKQSKKSKEESRT